MTSYGIPVPRNGVATTADEAEKMFETHLGKKTDEGSLDTVALEFVLPPPA